MSMRPQPWPQPSEEIATAVRAMYPGREVPLPVAIRDQLGEVFTDEAFGAGFAARGKPGWSPGRLALVTVLADGREPDRPTSRGGGAGEDLVEVRARRLRDPDRQNVVYAAAGAVVVMLRSWKRVCMLMRRVS
jgi:hypothetical protein